MYRALAEATRRSRAMTSRGRSRELRGAAARTASLGLVPTMGAFHAGHAALLRAPRARSATCVVASLFVNPAQFGAREDLERYPRDEERDARARRGRRASTSSSRRRPRRCTRPGSRPGSTSRSSAAASRAPRRPGHFRGVATVCLKLFNIVRPDARLLRPEGRPAGRRRRAAWCATSTSSSRSASCRPSATRTGSRSRSRNAYLSPEEREAARALPRALADGAIAATRGARACSPRAGRRARLRRGRRPRRPAPSRRRRPRRRAPA